jgi:signal transduction histidine kinase
MEGTREWKERARFDALRRRVFDELGRSAARWRLTWILPFNVIVLVMLVVQGLPRWRAIVLVSCVAVMATLFVARMFSEHRLLKTYGFFVGIASHLTMVLMTGGLCSPLLFTGALMLTSAAMTMQDPSWLRPVASLTFLGGFIGLALLSQTPIGRLPDPLVAVAGWATPEFISVALLSVVFTMLGVYRIGCQMTTGYERAALELHARREELCSENEDRSRALEGMAARLAHEVKNPLAAIKGLSVHMARNATDPKTAERLAIVAAEADRLQSIVDGFLSFSRGLDDLKVGPTKPYEVAQQLAVLLETRAEEAGVGIAVSGDAELVLDADARKLRQALLNLVVNAIQASPRGARVAVSVARECEGARIAVIDEGVGMTPEVLERIRKPHFTTKEGGSGLGVAVARGLVEQHGGRIEYKSASGKGTTVTILLPMKCKPCARLPNPARALQEREGDRPEPAPVAGMR